MALSVVVCYFLLLFFFIFRSFIEEYRLYSVHTVNNSAHVTNYHNCTLIHEYCKGDNKIRLRLISNPFVFSPSSLSFLLVSLR